ncbi:MAG TPA: GntR family transcriptional regulator [Solirubrobacteraceae bacterium]
MRVSDTVHAQLRSQILSGELAPGDAVPSERELAERLSVNRHAVREALNRLQQARLVQVSQGGATRVRDWRADAGLDLLIDLAREEQLDADLARAIVEMRASIGVDAARRCAERGPETTRRAAAALAREVIAAPDRTAVHEQLWRAIVDGSANIAYRLSLNTLVAGLAGREQLAAALTPPPEDDAALEALADALERQDADAAAAAAGTILGRPLRSARLPS